MRVIFNQLRFVIFAIFFSILLQCASPKVIATNFEDNTPFKIKSVYFQEWYAGINYGGTGYTLYLPVVQKESNVLVEEVYFRNLQGRFEFNDGRYIAILKKPGKDYMFGKPKKPDNYPFDLRDNECVITYSQEGQKKFYKVNIDKELAGTYYENGVPSIYSRPTSTGLATVDEDEE